MGVAPKKHNLRVLTFLQIVCPRQLPRVTSKTTPNHIVKNFLLTVVLLAAAYVISYACLVRPASIPEVKGAPPWKRAPEYAISGGFVRTVYDPLLKLDRRLFPQRWEF